MSRSRLQQAAVWSQRSNVGSHLNGQPQRGSHSRGGWGGGRGAGCRVGRGCRLRVPWAAVVLKPQWTTSRDEEEARSLQRPAKHLKPPCRAQPRPPSGLSSRHQNQRLIRVLAGRRQYLIGVHTPKPHPSRRQCGPHREGGPPQESAACPTTPGTVAKHPRELISVVTHQHPQPKQREILCLTQLLTLRGPGDGVGGNSNHARPQPARMG